MRHLLLTTLSVLGTLSSVHAQSSTTPTGSPVIESALPSATAALYNNTNARGAPNGKVFKYFMQIWLENENFTTISQIPQFQAVAAEGILLTNYNAISHPSQPNYIAAISGSNFGITDDDYYNIPSNESSIYDLLERKGLTWKAYNEDIPAAGWTGYINANGTYVRKHNPAITFDNIGLNQTRSANVVPATDFVVDVADNNVPAYSFYTPNMNNDGHDTNGSYAGAWLDEFLGSTLTNATFMKETLILITFDESEPYEGRNQVWACLIGGAIPAKLRNTTDNTFYTHYSALHTVELNWGLGSLNRSDANATLANVFAFASHTLGYKNVNVTNIPLMNGTITGLLTNQSYNATHNSTTSSSKSSAVPSTEVAHLFAMAGLSAIVAIVVPYLL